MDSHGIPIALEAEPDEDISYADELEDYDVVDLDAHYLESYKEIAPYVDEPWRTRLSQLYKDDPEKGKHAYGGGPFLPSSTGDRQQYGKIKREHSLYPEEPLVNMEGTDQKEKIKDSMDFLGIDKQVQISHLLLTLPGITADDARASYFFEGYVRYLRENVLDPDLGIFGTAPIIPDNIDKALEMFDTIEEEDGLVGATLITAGATPPLGNRKYDPIYERAEDMDIPIVFHTSGSGLDSLPGYQSFVETHTIGFLVANMSQLTSLVMEGVPEKFPDLEMAVVESGITYLPGLMARMDEEYLKRPEEAPLLDKRPSEYIQDNFYFGTQPLEKSADLNLLETCLDLIGPDQLLYASDYPHWDFDRPTTVTNLPMLSDEEKRMILSGNAEEVFAL